MADPLGSGAGIIVGVGVGAAASAALEPAVEIPKQEAWAANPNRILDAGLIARLVAEGGVDLGFAHDSGRRDGFQSDKMDALVYLAQTVPGAAEALELWRKGFIGPDLFLHALNKAARDPRYSFNGDAYRLKELIGLGDIAAGIVRSALPAPAYVPVPPPTSGTSIPRFPQVNIDPETLAAKLGFPPEMLQIMVARSGLSLAPGLSAQALFRGLINDQDFLLAVAEGDLRTEWADTLRDVSRQILTAGEYLEAELRGWLDPGVGVARTAKHGMSPADAQLRLDTMGRPIAVHQVTTGLARGGTYPSAYADVPEPYRKAIQESDIRPEWASLAYHNRYTYPSAFVLRTLAQAGDIGDTAAVEQVLLEIGWPPAFASKVAVAWAPTGATGDPHVTKAENQLWTATHRAYLNGHAPASTLTPAFTALGITPAAQQTVLGLWTLEQQLERFGLTAANIHKAFTKGDTNDATGQPWTRDEAIAELVKLGYNPDEAGQYLDIP
jgi:hypothetical protein